ncbi:MAG: hypothetical protein Q8L81_17180 [Bacteroidota bacterium]|nr:hypothetical protein [Bacteroidota bacterium]
MAEIKYIVTVKYPLTIVLTCIWIGFVCAISFMEAWLKFQAPGITLELGLGIGRLVFNALNKVELVLGLGIIFDLILTKKIEIDWKYLFLIFALIILIMQTIYALPALDKRAEMHISGLEVPSSNLHFYYVGMEFIKVVSLFIFGVKLFKKEKEL